MSVVINGTAGITTPGMESTAMPTVGDDPVVESGSNSDGEWTRWAEGTQITRSKVVLDLNTLSFQTFPYPVGYFSEDRLSLSVGFDNNPITGTNADWWNRLHQVVASLPPANRLAHVSLLFRTGGYGLAAVTGYAFITAIGRWK